MSGIRKFRRRKLPCPNRVEDRRRLSLRDILLIGGVVTAFGGLAAGLGSYLVYLNGSPEQILNTHEGTRYLPPLPPGDPGRLAGAYAGFATAGAGIAVLAGVLVSWVIEQIRVTREHGGTVEEDPVDGASC